MRVAQAQCQFLARLRDAVTHAANLQTLAKALAHALDHVRNERAHQTMCAAVLLCIALAADENSSVLQLDVDDAGEDLLAQLALRATDAHDVILHVHIDAGGHDDGQLTYARHSRTTLPDVCKNLSSDALLLRAFPRHDALRRRNDHQTESAEDSRYLRLARVDAQTGTRNAAKTRDDLLLLRAVPKLNSNLALRTFRNPFEALDETFVLQNLRDGLFRSRGRHVDRFVVGRVGVADARQHIGNRVGYRQVLALLTMRPS